MTNKIDSYLQAKNKTIELLKQVQLYREGQHNFNITFASIINTTSKCSHNQKGQVYLLLCKAAITINCHPLKLPFPPSYRDDIFSYLNHLMQYQPHKHSQTQSVYKLKLNRQPSQRRQRNSENGKLTLKDYLLIDRYDKVLVQLIQEGEQLQFSKQFISFLDQTVKIARRYLQTKDYHDYKDNISKLLGREVKIHQSTKRIGRVSHSFSLTNNFVFLDSIHQNTLKGNSFLYQRNNNLKRGTVQSKGQSARSSSSHRSSSKKSSFLDNELKNLAQNYRLKKNSMLNPSLNRKSGSSSCTMRSSIMNQNMTKIQSNFWFNKSNRNSSKIQPRPSEMKLTSTKPQRKSRFQVISKIDQETLLKEFEDQEEPESEVSIKQIKVMHKVSRLSSFYSGEIDDYERMNTFFLFLENRGRIYQLSVSQVSSFDLSKNAFGVFKCRIQQNELSICFDFQMEMEEEGTIEQVCLNYLVQHIRVNCFMGIKLTLEHQHPTTETQSQQHPNIVRCGSGDRLLVGFIRKISTYFIYISKYDMPVGYYEQDIRSKLLTIGSVLPIKISIRNKMMNSDLSMSFQQQESRQVQRGSVIPYIQSEDTVNIFDNGANYKLIFEHYTIKQDNDLRLFRIWTNPNYKIPMCPKKKNRRNQSKIFKSATAEDKKLKKIQHNKSSIRLQSPQLEALYQEHQLKLTTKVNSKKEVISDKRIREIAIIKVPTKKERITKMKTTVMVQTIRTDKGYKLVKKSMEEQLDGVKYDVYEGFRQRNPQFVKRSKEMSVLPERSNYLHSNMCIRCSGRGVRNTAANFQVGNLKLVQFVKMLHSSNNVFAGYLISEIKILTHSANRCIFIETYWQKMQKYFIFIISSQFFENLTDINTSDFWSKPLHKNQSKVSKKREKRTSVMNCLRSKEKINQSNSAFKRNKIRKENSLDDQRRNKNTLNVRKTENTENSYLTFNTVKNTQKIWLRKEILNKIKSRFCRNLQFQWKDHTLRLVIKPIMGVHLTITQYEGRQLAVKNVHASLSQPTIASATQLILIKYKENNLTNLNMFTQQGLNQISLEHIFIKNNQDLYGRYENILSLSQIPIDISLGEYYVRNNTFFNRSINKDVCHYQRMKTTLSKGRDQQKRSKYVDVINYARECSISFDLIENKRKKYITKSFVIPNRFSIFQDQDQILSISLEETICVRSLQGKEIIKFDIQKMEHYLPYIRQLGQKQFKEIFLKRVLQDQDIMRLCMYDQETIF